MVAKSRVKPPRVVLDTNTVVSALLFGCGRLAWLREAWQAGHFIPLLGHDTARELIRVLGYPKFKLTRPEQEALLADFLPFAEVVQVPTSTAGLPEVRDPHDGKFLALARAANAEVLVSGDQDLQALRGQLPPTAILTAAEFADWLAGIPIPSGTGTPDETGPA